MKGEQLVATSLFLGINAALAIKSLCRRRAGDKVAGAADPKPFSVIFVLGGPGAGKGTQCGKLVETFGVVHLSAGDLLRAERNSGSALAEMINGCIKEGKIVPAEVTVGLLKTAMQESGKTQFLIDGFPRDPDNLSTWERIMSPLSETLCLLFLDCPEDVMTQRLLARGETSGRLDDNEEAIRKRFVTYQQQTMPIIQQFEALGLVRKVVADQSIEAVFDEVCKQLRPLLQQA